MTKTPAHCTFLYAVNNIFAACVLTFYKKELSSRAITFLDEFV